MENKGIQQQKYFVLSGLGVKQHFETTDTQDFFIFLGLLFNLAHIIICITDIHVNHVTWQPYIYVTGQIYPDI